MTPPPFLLDAFSGMFAFKSEKGPKSLELECFGLCSQFPKKTGGYSKCFAGADGITFYTFTEWIQSQFQNQS